ncbi:MAG TPA: 30S ribosome-binding factor RbfA [Desulfobacterales bacterium]|jgi:ribosome-binding factor A|nr:30S ribosome-binding factor RbfA [Desulfobacterales bacterium]
MEDILMLTDYKRRDRIGELLREKIALILLRKSRDPRLQQITITSVAISDDLRRAKVYYLTRGQEAEVPANQKALQKASGFIKQELAQEHILRVMPELIFQLDDSWRRGERVDSLLRQLGQESTPPDDSQGSS